MRRYFTSILLFCAIAATAQNPAKGLRSINLAKAESVVYFLADDALQGREAGTDACKSAAAFLAAQLREAGIEPLFDGSYTQSFSGINRLSKREISMQNVCGIIRGRKADEYVVVCAHYDHLGVRPEVEGEDKIFNGADDNASGVQAVLQIGRAFIASGRQPERSVIIAFWDGEEQGLLGSGYFLENCSYKKEIKGCLNFDMIGRNNIPERPEQVVFFYSSQNPAFGEWLKRDISRYKLGIDPDYRPNERLLGGSDNANFVKNDIPFMWYHTDGHPDYHKPGDHPEKLNWTKMMEITKASFLGAWHLANEKEY